MTKSISLNGTKPQPNLRSQLRSQLGASMVEYALLVALIALIAIPAIGSLGTQTANTFQNAKEEVAGAGNIQATPIPCNAQHPNWPYC